MKIATIKITNYKSIATTEDIELDRHINVIVGQNNSGKSAILEGFHLNKISNKPHRGLYLSKGQLPPSSSEVIFSLTMRGSEFKQILLNRNSQLNLLLPTEFSDNPQKYLEYLFDSTELSFTFRTTSAGRLWSTQPGMNALGTAAMPPQGSFLVASATADRSELEVSHSYGDSDNLFQIMEEYIKDKVYVFNSKRIANGTCLHEITKSLLPDAHNLAAAVASMNFNPARSAIFNEHIRSIFPSIQAVVSGPGGLGLEIRVWPVNVTADRDDLTIPLDECGTGVSQVVAILYVIMNIDSGVIVIDEPNSFLHPGAAKNLLKLIQSYRMHQYIIATHSPEVISTLRDSKIFMARLQDGVTHISHPSNEDRDFVRTLIDDVGASPSDLFAYDKVIWVEGPTERECFTAIYHHCTKNYPSSFAILPLHATGDLEGRRVNAKMAISLYRRLSQGSHLLPISVCFFLDSEGKNPREKEDMSRELGEKIHFLPRRMIENYFIHIDAVRFVISSISGKCVSSDAVKEQIRLSFQKQGLSVDPQNLTLEDVRSVHGSKILQDVFWILSGETHEYRKVIDGPSLLGYILDNDPQHADELIQYFLNSLEKGGVVAVH